MSAIDLFFDLGNRATKGDATRKAQFDYYLYWIVFLAFLGIALNYYYNFFFKSSPPSTLLWAIVMTIFGWFNYYALGAFRGVYENMKKFKEAQSLIPKTNESESKPLDDNVKDMLEEFKDVK